MARIAIGMLPHVGQWTVRGTILQRAFLQQDLHGPGKRIHNDLQLPAKADLMLNRRKLNASELRVLHKPIHAFGSLRRIEAGKGPSLRIPGSGERYERNSAQLRR
ncbi:hypothetical protein [Noviherbaspirillum soli]|uniref:hypothetical protein n=1 Tax=Noviherbaspirillum soli TaxID=1064518 RepID=UPI00188AF28A|nr:hypothetical protein [Noviherbaspirillum soli]